MDLVSTMSEGKEFQTLITLLEKKFSCQLVLHRAPINFYHDHLSSIPTLPAFRRALKHHLFILAYPDSNAKSGKIKPAQCITLRDTAPTTATAPPEISCRPSKGVPPERLRLVEVNNFAQATYWRMCKSCVTYLLAYKIEGRVRKNCKNLQKSHTVSAEWELVAIQSCA